MHLGPELMFAAINVVFLSLSVHSTHISSTHKNSHIYI